MNSFEKGRRVRLTADWESYYEGRLGTLATWTPGGGPEVVSDGTHAAVFFDGDLTRTYPGGHFVPHKYPTAVPVVLLALVESEAPGVVSGKERLEALVKYGMEAYGRVHPFAMATSAKRAAFERELRERMAQFVQVDILERDS